MNEEELLKQLAIYPDEVLMKPASKVEENEFGNKLKNIIDTMFKIMYHFKGIGLGAPQAKCSKRILVLDLQNEEEFIGINCITGEKLISQKLVMINPEILELSQEMDEMKEGCLSLPGILIPITRPKTVKVKFVNEENQEFIYFMENLLGRCVQHEIDHLNGILIIDKLDPKIKRILIGDKLDKLRKQKR